MAIVTNKITIYKGNPYTGRLTMENTDGTPYDLTGKTVFFTVKELDDDTDTDSTALITEDVTTHVDESNGVTDVVLDANQTNIPVGIYKWDVRIYDAAESSGALPIQANTETGTCEVKDIVTKRTA